jgi:hypothetical protein
MEDAYLEFVYQLTKKWKKINQLPSRTLSEQSTDQCRYFPKDILTHDIDQPGKSVTSLRRL